MIGVVFDLTEREERVRQLPAQIRRRLPRDRHRRIQIECALIAAPRVVQLAEIGCALASLHRAQPLIRLRQLEDEPLVASRVLRKAIQILASGVDDGGTYRGGTRQRRDLIVELEQEGVCQLANLVETALGTARLNRGDGNAAEQAHRQGQAGDHRETVSLDEFPATFER